MPRYAIVDNGDRIHIDTASSDDERTFYCPSCGRPQSIAGGDRTQVRKHFRHYPNEACEVYENWKETPRHLDGKSEIEYQLLEADWASDVQLERRIDPNKPDVLFDLDGVRVGVEIQVSSITATEVLNRTKERSAAGIYTMWVFETGQYRSTKVSTSGNEYVSFKTGELGYLSMTDQHGVAQIPYLDTRSDTSARTSWFLQKYELFDEEQGGWPEAMTPLHEIGVYTTTNGLRLATAPAAIPDDTGDDSQSRLF